MAQKESGEYFFMNIIKNLFMPSAAGATTIARKTRDDHAPPRTDGRIGGRSSRRARSSSHGRLRVR